MTEKPKILIIDDDKALCESLVDILELEGCLTETTHTANDGMDKIKECFYNIILLDMRLPDSDGITILRKIKNISPDTEVIVFTAYAEMDIVIRAMDRNAFSFLPKPFEPQYMITTIKRALQKQMIMFENRNLFQQVSKGKKDWEATFDSISDLISIHDKDFNIIRCNKAVADKLNIKSEDIIGKKCYELFHSKNEPWPTCPFLRCKESLKSESEEEECLGGVFLMSCFPRFNETGKFDGVVHIARDITEHKLAEKTITHLASFPQLNLNPIIELNDAGSVTFHNDAVTKVLTEMGTNDDISILLPEDINEIIKELKNKERLQLYRELEVGNSTFAEYIYTLPCLKVVRIYATDITKRKLVQNKLQESEELFRCTFDQAGVGIAHVSTNGRFLKMNKLFCNILGHTEEELLTLTLQDITHYDKLKTDTNSVNQKLDDTFQTYTMEKRYLKKEGTIVWVNLTVSLVRKPDGEPKYFICVVEDITERKQIENVLQENEEMFRAISTTAHEAIIMTDNKGTILYWNTAAENIFGYSAAEAIGKKLHETIVPDQYREAHLKGFDKFKDTGKGDFIRKTLETLARKKDDTVFPLEISIAAVKLKGSWCAIGIARDITDRKRMENKLRVSYKMSSLGELTSGVFHELLNPVNIISSHVQLLLMDAERGSKAEEDLKSIQEEIRRIVKISDGLLRFARKGAPCSEKIEINDLLERIISILEPDMKLERVIFNRKFDDSLPLVTANSDQLRQVVLNLITNARDAMPEGGTITVSTENITGGEISFIRLKITDTGCGIDKEIIDAVFDPFFTTKAEGKGTGLGLSTSYGIIEAHGGAMSVESKVGQGTTFIIDLPVKV